jgi:pyridoxamine 5'-phosphate oxidase
MRFGLTERDVSADPFEQFDAWFRSAVEAGVPLANAMALATADARTGRPSLRQVLLKGYDASGFVFYTSFDSRKGRELESNPQASVLFWWNELERQVRIEGSVMRVTEAESDEYFASRPVGSRLGACASPQSAPLAGREALEALLAEATARYGDAPPRPANWGGYRIVPEHFEFWQGRENRLHDRIIYTGSAAQGWRIGRLGP